MRDSNVFDLTANWSTERCREAEMEPQLVSVAGEILNNRTIKLDQWIKSELDEG